MPKKIGTQFGARLREMRLSRGLRQKDVGKLVGRTKACVCQWEKGAKPPRDAEAILRAIQNVPDMRDPDASGAFNFARYKRLTVLSSALEAVAEQSKLLSERWMTQKMSGISELRKRVYQELRGFSDGRGR